MSTVHIAGESHIPTVRAGLLAQAADQFKQTPRAYDHTHKALNFAALSAHWPMQTSHAAHAHKTP